MSKKPKKPLLLRFLPYVFQFLERINSRLSGRLALYLFLHPPRFQRPEREMKCYHSSIKSTLLVEGNEIAVYEWGDGPIIWIMHGWAGRSTQLSLIISSLVKSGYRVIGADAPAHGNSKGKESSVLLFEKTLEALHQQYGKAYAYIGHSLGGAVGFYAMNNGMTFDKYVSISAPTIPTLILHEAFDKIGAKQTSIDAMCQLIYERIGEPFENYTATHWAQSAPEIPYLIIHDEADFEADIAHAKALKDIIPKADTLFSKGLGHVRILRDDLIIEKIIDFVKS